MQRSMKLDGQDWTRHGTLEGLLLRDVGDGLWIRDTLKGFMDAQEQFGGNRAVAA